MSQAELIIALEEFRADILRFLRARTGNAEDAEDLASDLYLKLRVLKLQMPVDNPRSYLFSMANRLVLDRLRETQRRARREMNWAREKISDPGYPAKDDRPDPESLVIAGDEASRLRLAIAALPPRARRALVLHKIDGLTQLEVAEQLGISRSAVEKHMAVAMGRLRRTLGGLR